MADKFDFDDAHMDLDALDDDFFVDTVTVSKLAYLVPIIEKIFLSQDSELRLKTLILGFLKRSVNDTFIKVF